MEDAQRPKQAACLLNAECIRPTFHAGRQKGIKNKRKGLEKALFQIEQALKRVKSGEQNDEDSRALFDLQNLLVETKDHPSVSSSTTRLQRRETVDGGDDLSTDEDDETEDTPDSNAYVAHHREGSLTIDDAENPLQLLARASNLQLSPTPGGPSPGPITKSGRKRQQPEQPDEDTEIQSFFTSVRVNLDVGDEIDPISMGLVTEAEAEDLFTYFHKNLAHTRWGLDPAINTVSFTRARSAFLTTSIMASSALFRPQDAALSKRLSTHAKGLAHRVIIKGHKSVEIVLAFMVNVPWMFPGQHSTDDETCWYVSMAMTIAIDLSVHKLLVSTDMLGSAAAVARGDCVDPPRGRSFTVPITRSLRDCDNWHRSDIADPADGHLVSMAVLRRDLDSIFATVRAMCDGSQNTFSDGSLIAQSIQGAIERFFDQWNTDWGLSIGSGPERKLPPYVEILVTHTRLSIYSGVINHPTAPIEVRQFFRTAGMSSALTVLRVAIQGEARLQSMPNNTCIMIAFAACFALTLSAYASGSSNLAPSVRNLIEQTACVLERVGNKTKHRNGLSTLYGKYLRGLTKKAATAAEEHSVAHFQPAAETLGAAQFGFTAIPASNDQSLAALGTAEAQPGYPQPPTQSQLWPETLQFSTMSEEQIIEILNQPHNAFDPAGANLSWEDMDNFEGLNWPNLPGFNY
ncbi:Satratoxin biosynthesis SC1 cluster transcription factor SAT9 like protein [Verticillium longisporum]|nr:Satratoxin biosynthesis SC1 cluster transcription factor SAT9 like protein [Verticillium longisporum]